MFSPTVVAPDYDVLSAALQGALSGLEGSECHGMLVGMLCGSGSGRDLNWLPYVFDTEGLADGELGDAEAGEKDAPSDGGDEWQQRARCVGLLDDLFAWTVQGLESEDLAFDLLLPDEDEDLDTRTEGLAAWARGFLAGLGLSGVSEEAASEAAVAEVLEDFGQISQSYADEDPETSEADLDEAFAEVQEYMRMSVMMVFNEFRHEANEREVH